MSPTSRRDHGSGSVYQRADGRWYGTVEAGITASGARRRISVSGKTKAGVQRRLREKQRQIAEDGAPSTTARVTVRTFADRWLEQRRAVVRAKPWATDASAVRTWIIPTIGHKQLTELVPADLRAVARAQARAGRSTSTARRTHTTLTALLKAAMLEGHAVPARVLLVEAPPVAVSTRDAMPAEQLEAVLSVAMDLLPHWSRWLTQALYGQRPAEVLGLTDDALDFERKVIRIEWQLQTLPYRDRGDRSKGFVVPDGMPVRHLVDAWHLTPPKTKRGLRVVPMLPIAEAAYRQWLEVRGPSPHGLLWPAATGRPANDKHDIEEWHALQCTAGVGRPDGKWWSIYEARHGFATRLLEGGVDERIVTDLMGHSSIFTSRGYMHVQTDRALEALTLINAGLTQQRPRPAAPAADGGTRALPGAASPGGP